VTHRQHPLGSGFSAASTVDDVLRGIDLAGRHVIVTAGHSGLGLEVTRGLSAVGASVTVAARRPDRAAAAASGIDRVRVERLDLLDPPSVDAFAAGYVASGTPLRILVNGAGVPSPAELVTDSRGYEVQFATDHLGHFQLANGLLPALRAEGARVVNVSSGAQRFGRIRWKDPNFTSGDYDPFVAYAQAKLANVLHAVEMDRRWSTYGIRAYAVHPGVVVGTALNSATGQEELKAMGLVDESGAPIIDPARGKKTPAQGASTIVFAATSPLLAGIGGVYLKDNDIAPLDDTPRPVTPEDIPAEAASHSIDPEAARRLWDLSEKLLAA
jgi:NAD(P)-dependent dehydrogenase (short-subunit alcohol dehydrogenase family)